MSVGGHGAQRLRFTGAGDVEVDAVEIIARLLGRDGKLRLVDEPFQVGSLQRKFVGHFAGSEIGKIAFRQALQRETRTAGADRKRGPIPGRFEDDLCAVRQLAYDVIEHVGRHGRRAAGPSFGRDGVGYFKIEVGRLQAEFRAIGADEHVGEDRNGVAPLHGAMHVPERPQQFRTLYGDLHRNIPFRAGGAKVAWPGAFGKGTAQSVRLFPCVSHSNSAPEAARSSYRFGPRGARARAPPKPPTGWIKQPGPPPPSPDCSVRDLA